MDSNGKAARRVGSRRTRAEAARRAAARRRRIRIGVWAAGAVAVAVLVGAILFANLGSDGPGSTAVTAADPVLGDRAAPVTIVEYGDFKCPFCTRFFIQTEPHLRQRYIDTGKVRLAWRDFANIDAESEPAAAAAWCAGKQSRFWPYHDALYHYVWNNFYGKGSNVEGRPAYQGHYLDLARQAGVSDLDAFRSCLDSGEARDAVRQDRDLGTSQGVQGTPTFFVNGHKIVGAQPFEVFAEIIDRQLRGS